MLSFHEISNNSDKNLTNTEENETLIGMLPDYELRISPRCLS